MAASVTGIKQATQEIERQLILLHKTIMFDLDLAIVEATPRDTGRAKGNWIASVGAPHRGITDKLEKTNNTHSIDLIKRPCISYLSNNLPYIQRLNEGWSKLQAPAGYIEDAVNKVVEAHKVARAKQRRKESYQARKLKKQLSKN